MIENLSIETVIVVACVCGSVVLILSIVLIVLCCQRHRTKDLYEKTETNILEPSDAGKPTSDATTLRPPDAAPAETPSAAPSHPPHHHHQQHQQLVQDDCSRASPMPQALKDCDNARASYRASNPALANYPSLDRGMAKCSEHPLNSLPSVAAAADDKRPRKVIYEVIV